MKQAREHKMRDYILTPSEKQIIQRYIETGDKLEGFRVLLCRVRKHKPTQIMDDEELIKLFLAKVGEKA
jgi:hypothetical protein